MKKTLPFILSLFLLNTILFADSTADKIRLQNQNVIKMAASDMSKQLPQKVDDYTQLVKIEAKEQTLAYTFEINTGAKSDEAVIKEDKSRMKKAVTIGICNSSKRFLQSGIDISYIYTSAVSKRMLFQFDVNKKDCDYMD
ncbi:MAG: hypothetical protein P794_01340 [Epsilonproteobacteria bacterium (ex Lamellibrachia satsuma)]|nr:MAG: hypothetical protein P794_01340 [Epsilonproteobacteria bacterium (ex Lamellibrachia satsuma)]